MFPEPLFSFLGFPLVFSRLLFEKNIGVNSYVKTRLRLIIDLPQIKTQLTRKRFLIEEVYFFLVIRKTNKKYFT